MISNSKIDSGKEFDWGFASEEYTKFRDIYPPALYEKLRKNGVVADGTAWLDLGTGTGILPLNLYNPKARITGTDISPEQIQFAKKAAKEKNFNIDFRVSPAENLPFEDKSFDTVTAAQCFWYFEREKAKKEIERLIKPGGKFIKILLDWDYEDALAKRSIALVKKYNPLWEPEGLAEKDIFDDLFEGRETIESIQEISFSRESWHGRMCACRGTLASMNKEQFENWSREHKALVSSFPEKFVINHKLYITIFKF